MSKSVLGSQQQRYDQTSRPPPLSEISIPGAYPIVSQTVGAPVLVTMPVQASTFGMYSTRAVSPTDMLVGENQPPQQKETGRSAAPNKSGATPSLMMMAQKDAVRHDATDDLSIGSPESQAWDEATGIVGSIARFIKNHYYSAFGIFLLAVIVMVGTVQVLPPDAKCLEDAGAGQMQVCEQSEHDWELSFRTASRRKDAVGFARIEGMEGFQDFAVRELGSERQDGETPRSSPSDFSDLRVVYWHKDEDANMETNIFTPKKVQAMCQIEASLLAHPFYPNFCLLKADSGNCRPQAYSVAARFYTEDQLTSCPLLTDVEVKAMSDELSAGYASDPARSFFAKIDAVQGGVTNSTRSYLQLGAPLEGYSDADDRFSEQLDKYQLMFADTKCGDWKDGCDDDSLCKATREYCAKSGVTDGDTVEGVETRLFKRYELEGFPTSGQFEGAFASPYMGAKPSEEFDNGEAEMAVRFWSIPLQQEEFTRVVNGDLNFAIFSVVVVGFYIWFHTGSAFIATLAMFQIVMSLPVGFFLYYNIFQIKYYASVNILAIYLALGIGADSVFVASDCWNQSRSNPQIKTILGRLAYTINRTVTSCFNTTLTTVMSFVATSATPVVPIYCFAVFAALVLCVNYLFVCLVTPTILMIHHVHFSDLGGLCCWCSKATTGRFGAKEPKAKQELAEVRDKDPLYKMCCYSKFAAPNMEQDAEAPVESEEPHSEVSQLSVSERFFHNHFSRLFSYRVAGHKVGAYVSIVCCLAYAAGMSSQAFRLTPPTSEEQWFPPSHMFNADLNARLFDDWKGSSDNAYMNMAFVFGVEGVDRSPHNRLFPNHDRGSVVYDPAFNLASEASQRFFVDVCTQLEVVPCDAAACQDGKLVRANLQCVVRDLIGFYNAQHNLTATDQVSAIPSASFVGTVRDFFAAGGDEALGQQRIASYASNLGMNGEEPLAIEWAAITFRSSVSLPMTNKDSREIFDWVEDMTETLAESAPEGMESLFQTDTQSSGEGWTWMDVEDALIQNLITGFTICFPVAFIVLVFATGNVVIAIFATASIAFIVGGVLGAAKAYYGWDLGIAESIAGVIVIGFSVDYTVHLGHMYKEGIGSREDKTRHALTYMGTTVVGGGLTTLCAGLVLFLCTLTFFTKMALLLVWTIILSIIYALFFFMPMCCLFGPEGTFGEVPSIQQLLNMALKSCKGSK